MSKLDTPVPGHLLDAYTYVVDTAASIRAIHLKHITIDDTARLEVLIDKKDNEPYEDWLMRNVIKYGIGNPVPLTEYLDMPMTKRIAANSVGHTTMEGQFTTKARKYLEAVEIMKAREADGSIVRRD